jgi:DNA-binding response OmpR family regulator
MRILLIEDEVSLAELLRQALEQRSYAVDVAHNAEDGEKFVESAPYDLILLDIILPGKNGLELCRSLREKKNNVPVMLITARKKADEEVAYGLDCGADDYLFKPFSLEVLFARMRALLRRKTKISAAKVNWGDLSLDTVNRQLWIDQKEIRLTHKEYAIMEYLMYHQDQVVTRTKLEQHIWNMNLDSSSNMIEAHIKRLRAKLKQNENGDIIETVRGQGYRLRMGQDSAD